MAPSRLSPRLGLWLLPVNAVAVAGLVAVAAVLTAQAHRDAEQRSDAAARGVVQTLGRDIARNLELYDLSLLAVAENAVRPEVMALSPDLRRLVLFDRAATAPGFGTILVTDATGATVLTSQDPFGHPTNGLSLREGGAFQHFSAHPEDDGLQIGPPLISPFSGQWAVPLSRRLTDADGRFAGIVVGAIKLDYLRGLFASVGAERAGTVTLFGPGGTVLMREPFDRTLIGSSLGTDTSYARMLVVREGTIVGPALFGAGERRFTFGRVGESPLMLDVAVRPAGIHAAWRRQAVALGLILLALCAVTLGMTWLLSRELARRRRTEARLARANTELTALVRTDPLTGLGNRRRFDEALEREWRRAVQQRRPLALVLIDADHFKGFNDTYGHQAGDAALRAIGAALAAGVGRPGDLACRIGGEEFALLLPEIDLPGAMAVAERVRTALRERAVPHRGSPSGVLTLSCGLVAAIPGEFGSGEAAVAAADEALYAAKAGGRDRTVIASSAKGARRLAG